jgi:1-acyl-sn-glycerol-3-phosphate acyltransferase
LAGCTSETNLAGRRAIIVFNHVSYVDPIAMVAVFAPSGIAKASVASIPCFGVFAIALQFLFVRRRGTSDVANKHSVVGHATEKIAERAADPRQVTGRCPSG